MYLVLFVFRIWYPKGISNSIKAVAKTNISPCLLQMNTIDFLYGNSDIGEENILLQQFYPNQCVFWFQEGGSLKMADVRGVWRDTDFASSLQHFIFLRRAKFHGFKRTLTFSHAKATTKGPLEMSIRFGLFLCIFWMK